jgi:hypothetical protein
LQEVIFVFTQLPLSHLSVVQLLLSTHCASDVQLGVALSQPFETSGFAVTVPQLLESVHVLDWLPLVHWLHAVQLQFSVHATSFGTNMSTALIPLFGTEMTSWVSWYPGAVTFREYCPDGNLSEACPLALEATSFKKFPSRS